METGLSSHPIALRRSDGRPPAWQAPLHYGRRIPPQATAGKRNIYTPQRISVVFGVSLKVSLAVGKSELPRPCCEYW
jgi:hypothetical protein